MEKIRRGSGESSMCSGLVKQVQDVMKSSLLLSEGDQLDWKDELQRKSVKRRKRNLRSN